MCDLDQAAEAHVDAGGEDGGCDQDENCVDRVDGDGEVGGFICSDGSLERKMLGVIRSMIIAASHTVMNPMTSTANNGLAMA